MKTRNRIATVLAAASLALVSVSAAAAVVTDPDSAATTTVKQETAKPALSKKALRMVWCFARKDDPTGKKECKTREKWIAEGKGTFAKN